AGIRPPREANDKNSCPAVQRRPAALRQWRARQRPDWRQNVATKSRRTRDRLRSGLLVVSLAAAAAREEARTARLQTQTRHRQRAARESSSRAHSGTAY